MQDHIPANISEGMVPFLYIVGQILDYYKDLSGREWADTVKGHICIEDNTKPGPPLHAEDIIQGPITSNNNSVYHCCNPIQSEKLQVVARTFNGMDVLAPYFLSLLIYKIEVLVEAFRNLTLLLIMMYLVK
ncbi:unnamed protein product [Rhizophagus irregularis]|uniref:Uncharacterized protein n=1 Tax=Rhizophagus irregularis TaxID=588596 RepID=A0A2N1MMX7_9GLOM|nr:hypothetical protein RhiirC2_789558 [Rhizophagus irregularis]CAB4389474.1 unnamed protein product [Rhizophagus irregularis]CAB5389540.1 unnamed protein product [Rhizophagus irregularis]CAB5395339.1 unnamed protein product [Rhizophagus irregularis]